MAGTATAGRRFSSIVIKKGNAKGPTPLDPDAPLRAEVSRMRREQRLVETEAEELFGDDETNRRIGLELQRFLSAELGGASVGTLVELDWHEWSQLARVALATTLLGKTGYQRLTHHESFTNADIEIPPLVFEKFRAKNGEQEVKVSLGAYRLCTRSLDYVLSDELWRESLPQTAGIMKRALSETLTEARREYIESERQKRR